MRGHITKRSKDSWSIVLDLGRDPATGRRRQQRVSIKGTKKDAERRLAELLHQVDTGGFVRPSRLTVGDFLRQWLRDYASTNVRARTYEGYAQKLERHVIPAIGPLALTSLQPPHLQELYRTLLEHGLSARTVLHVHRILSEALAHAVKWGLVARNVAQAVDPPRPVKKEMRTLDGDGVRRLLEAARGTAYYPLIHLATYTGMRRSELLGLRWKDVDLNMATISVVQTLHQVKGGAIVIEAPKTAKGRRQVALSPAAVLALRVLRERQEADCTLLGTGWDEARLMFASSDGAPMLPNTVTHAFIKIARRAGLHGVRLHDLRHTHASLMLRQGVHPKIVSERLGHATIAITLDTYSHVTPGLQEAAARRFDDALAEPPVPQATAGTM